MSVWSPPPGPEIAQGHEGRAHESPMGVDASVGLSDQYAGLSIAVLIPCYNEGDTIAEVVHAFRRELPRADVYVYDNNSTDGTVEMARAAGALVLTERYQGKGHVVCSMFRN